MDCTATTLSYQQTGYFSRLMIDYLNQDPVLAPFFQYPPTLEGIESAIARRLEFPTNRSILCSALREQYRQVPIPEQVIANVEKLTQENTFTVTTAHQPAIFTGSLFFLYKIIHAIKLADYLNTRLPGRHFVPVYYMGNEDADLEELGHIYLNGEKIAWMTDQKGAVGRMRTKGLDKIIDRIEGQFSGQPYGRELVSMIKDAYLGADNLQSATFSLVNKLFGHYGLVVLIPDTAGLKRLMEPIFSDDLQYQTAAGLVGGTIRALPEKYKVQASPRKINLFYLADNSRELIESEGDRYRVRNTARTFSAADILQELRHHPERFSPNVILRGLYQSVILPDIAFVGGGGETAYWLELKSLFGHYGVPYPALVIRNSFLVIEKKWSDAIRKTGLSVADMFRAEEELINALVKKESKHQLGLDVEIAAAENYYANLQTIAADVDTSLVQHVESLRVKALKEIKGFEKKLLRNEKRKFEDVRRQIHSIKTALFPLGSLQERLDNFVPFYAKWGSEFVQEVYHRSPVLEQYFTILEERPEV